MRKHKHLLRLHVILLSVTEHGCLVVVFNPAAPPRFRLPPYAAPQRLANHIFATFALYTLTLATVGGLAAGALAP